MISVVIPHLLDHLGFPHTILFLAAAMVIPTAASLVFNVPRQTSCNQEEEKAVVETTEPSLLNILRSREMIIYFLSFFLSFLGIFATFSFDCERSHLDFGLTKEDSHTLFFIIGISSCVGRIIFGKLLDFFRKIAMLLITAAFLANAVLILISSYLTSFNGQVIFSMVFGLTFGAIASGMVLSLTLISQHKVTERVGVLGIVLASASLVGPLIVGVIIDGYGTASENAWRVSFIVVGGFGLVGTGLFSWLACMLYNKPQDPAMSSSA